MHQGIVAEVSVTIGQHDDGPWRRNATQWVLLVDFALGRLRIVAMAQSSITLNKIQGAECERVKNHLQGEWV